MKRELKKIRKMIVLLASKSSVKFDDNAYDILNTHCLLYQTPSYIDYQQSLKDASKELNLSEPDTLNLVNLFKAYNLIFTAKNIMDEME